MAALSSLPLAGCSDADDDAPRPLVGPQREVAAVIEDFERATATRDFERICTQLFTVEVRQRAGGRRCPATLRQTAADVRNPQIAVRSVELDGERVEARVTTRADGQAETADTIELRRERGRFRISSLGG